MDSLTSVRQVRRALVVFTAQAVVGCALIVLGWVWPTPTLATLLSYSAVVIVAMVATSWLAGAVAIGYRTLTTAEVEQLRTFRLIHLTPQPLPVDPEGQVTLRVDRCRVAARVFDRHRPWRVPRAATYVFASDPSPTQTRHNVSRRRGRHRYVLAGDNLPATTMIRDNAIAIPADLTALVVEHTTR